MQDQSIADPIMKLAKDQTFYKHPLKYVDTQSVQTGWSTWAWCAGIAIVTIGVLYFGYVIATDPTPSFNPSKLSFNPLRWWGGDRGVQAPSAEIPDARSMMHNEENTVGLLGWLYDKVSGVPRSIGRVLNPYTYFQTGDDVGSAYTHFLSTQADQGLADRRYYPFTENNPFEPTYKKWLKAIFGETTSARADRLQELAQNRDVYYKDLLNPFIPQPHIPDLSNLNLSAAASGVRTPVMGLGLGVNSALPGNTPADLINAAELSHRLSSLPQTPDLTPLASTPPMANTAVWEGESTDSTFAQIREYYNNLTHSISTAVTNDQHTADRVASVARLTETSQSTLVNNPIPLPDVVIPVVATTGATHAIHQVMESLPVEVVTPLQHATDVVSPIVDTATRPLLEDVTVNPLVEIVDVNLTGDLTSALDQAVDVVRETIKKSPKLRVPNALVDDDVVSNYSAIFKYIEAIKGVTFKIAATNKISVEHRELLDPVQLAALTFLHDAADITTEADLLDAKVYYIEHLRGAPSMTKELADAINLANSGTDPLNLLTYNSLCFCCFFL